MLPAQAQIDVSRGHGANRDRASGRGRAQESGDRGRIAPRGREPGGTHRAAGAVMAQTAASARNTIGTATTRAARGAVIIIIDLYRAILSPILTAAIGPA